MAVDVENDLIGSELVNVLMYPSLISRVMWRLGWKGQGKLESGMTPEFLACLMLGMVGTDRPEGVRFDVGYGASRQRVRFSQP